MRASHDSQVVSHKEISQPSLEYQDPNVQYQEPQPVKKQTNSRIQLKKLAEDKRQLEDLNKEQFSTADPKDTKNLNECSRVEEELT